MSALATLAGSAGLKIVQRIITTKFGAGAGDLAGSVLDAIAEQVGVDRDELDQAAEDQPAAVTRAMQMVEERSPDLIAAYAAEIELQKAQLAAEKDDPAWMRAWRPGWMYLLGFLWLWNLVILHLINAVWKTALPPLPTTDLLGLTALFLSLYMGGHTVLRALGKAGGK